jgi:hypothetical protein
MNYLEIFKSYQRLDFVGENVWLRGDNQVSQHPDFLSPEQLRQFFTWAMENENIKHIASDFYYITESVKFDGMILRVPTGEIQGIIPGCNCFGCILPDGSIHT